MQQLRKWLERLIVAEQGSVRFWRVPAQDCAQRQLLGRTAASPEWEDRFTEGAALAEARTHNSTRGLRAPLRRWRFEGFPLGRQRA
jgi:hypothetical protein